MKLILALSAIKGIIRDVEKAINNDGLEPEEIRTAGITALKSIKKICELEEN